MIVWYCETGFYLIVQMDNSRIRVGKMVAEDSTGTRRRRAATSGISVELEISDSPANEAQTIDTSASVPDTIVDAQPTWLETACVSLISGFQNEALSKGKPAISTTSRFQSNFCLRLSGIPSFSIT